MTSIVRRLPGASASTTGSMARPMNGEAERREQEPLAPLPQAFAWERFATEERKVGWDGYLSYDGVLYGLPASPPLAGAVVQVRERHGKLSLWAAGQPNRAPAHTPP